MESVSVSPTDVHGVPLTDLLARCRSMAHRFYRQHGRWEPLEEYLSAGHMAIAECIQRFDTALAPPGGFVTYCVFQMEVTMRQVRYQAAGPWNIPRRRKGVVSRPKYTTEVVDEETLAALRTTPATQETQVYLREIVGYLMQSGPNGMLVLAMADETPLDELATAWQYSLVAVKDRQKKLRRKLRTWAQWSAA